MMTLIADLLPPPTFLGPVFPAEPAAVDAVQQYSGWDFVQWDTALAGSDPHCVGVAIKPLSANAPAPAASVDNDAFEQLMRRGKGKQQQRQAQRGGGFRKSQ
jgi:hypothetical protein